MRELYLQLQHLNRIKNPIVNRIRQQLCHEWPEVAEREVRRDWLKPNPPGLWKAIGGEWSVKWRKEQERSIGTGISSFSQGLAQQLCQLEQQEYQIELRIQQELNKPCYAPYMEVFSRYLISDRTSVALLGVIYPIQKFLKPNGKCIVEKVQTKKGKTATRNRSLAAFKLACGVGMVWHQSGSYEGWMPGGRSDIRTALWRWCKMAIVIQSIQSKDSEALASLRSYYEKGTDQRIEGEIQHFNPGIRNQRVMRVVRRMLERLFKDLLKAVF